MLIINLINRDKTQLLKHYIIHMLQTFELEIFELELPKLNWVSVCQFTLENVSKFQLQSVWWIDCNLEIRCIESEYLKVNKAIWIIEFKNCK